MYNTDDHYLIGRPNAQNQGQIGGGGGLGGQMTPPLA